MKVEVSGYECVYYNYQWSRNTIQAAQGTRISGGIDVDCIGCGESVDIGDEFVEAVDVVGDMDDEECGIDHGNMSGTLDPDFLNLCLKKMCTTNTTTYCSFCEGHAHEV